MGKITEQLLWEDRSRGDVTRAAHFAIANLFIGIWVVILGLFFSDQGTPAIGVGMVGLGFVMAILPTTIWLKARSEKGVVVRVDEIEVPAVGGHLFFRVHPRQTIAIGDIESFQIGEPEPSFRYRWRLVLWLKSGSSVNTHLGTESVSGLRSAMASLRVIERQ